MQPPKPSRMTPVTITDRHDQMNLDAIGTIAGFSPYTPPSDHWVNPSNYLSAATAQTTTGMVLFMPFDVGPNSLSVKGLGINVAIAANLGSATSGVVHLGIYRGDATGGQPDQTQLVVSAIVPDLTTLGIKYAAFGSPVTLVSGRYWLAFLSVYVGNATTYAQYSGYGTVVITLPFPGSSTPGLPARMWQTATGQTALPTIPLSLSTYSGTNGPVVSVRAN